MSENTNQENDGDSKADAIAIVALLTIILVTVIYWLSRL
jgi:membrane protein involved in colicin uptake